MKITNLFKIAVLLCSLTFLLFNCQNDDNENLPENIQDKNKFEKLFKTKLVSKQLNLGEDNIYVNWNQPNILELSKDEKRGTYQYSIELKESIINSSDLFVDKLIFKLIVSEKEDQVDFTILRYEPFKNSLNVSPSETNLEGFSGMKFIFNELGIIQDIYTYQSGDKIASFNENKDNRKGKYTDILFSRAASSADFDDCTDLNGNPIENCTGSNDGSGSGSGAGGGGGGYVLETTRNYTDWYNMCNTCDNSDGTIYYHTDGNKYIYIKTVYNGSTSRWVWVSGGGNRYIDFFDSRTGGGSRGPNFNTNDQRNYSGSSNDETGDELPCPIGYQKIGYDCVKIVEEDDQIINELTGKAKCIFDALKNSSTGFKNMIKKFDGEFPVSHLNFTINNTLSNGNYGITMPPNNFVIEIQFSNTQLENISDLGSAVSIAHEAIHAEIFRKMLSAAQRGDLDPDNMTQQQQIDYINNLRNNFPGIYDYYVDRYRSTWNHNLMAQHYISTIADIVGEFDNNTLTRQVYEDIAWAGLTIINNPNTGGSEISVAWNNLSPDEKSRINSNISNYFTNGTSDCN
ncbi:hypothetical protein [Tenacibaculum xiamenense]|uniref:hypothetical protein n=1 Tax=Tenacibaculum xiamenense TaxID=1261553 RepID=UPI00389385AB